MQKRLRLVIGLAAALLGPGFAASAQSRKVPEALMTAAAAAPQRVIVQLATPAEGGRQEAVRRPEAYVVGALGRDATAVAGIGDAPYVVASVGGAGLAKLQRDKSVKRVLPDRVVRAFLPESTKLLNVPEVWSHETRGGGAAVAIVDTGVNAQHPFFKGRIVAEACFSSTDAAHGSTTLCPNGQNEQIGAGAAAPCDPRAVAHACIHGTHVAGIAAGADGSADGVTLNGVAPGATIVAVDVFSRFEGEAVCGKGQRACVSAWTSDVLRGLLYVEQTAARTHVAAVNLSLGSGKYDAACDAQSAYNDVIERMTKEGIAVVVAAGNDGFAGAVSEPGCVSSAVTVSATRKDGVIDTDYANTSSIVKLVAPGTQILSAAGDGYVRLDGTSMATPHVTGLIALMRSAHPKATVAEIVAALQKSGKSETDARDDLTFALPDAEAAMALLNAADPDTQPAPIAQQPAPDAPDPRVGACGPVCVEVDKTSRRVIFVLARHDAVSPDVLASLRALFGERSKVQDIGDGKLVVEIPADADASAVERARRSTGADTRIFPDQPLKALTPGGRVVIH